METSIVTGDQVRLARELLGYAHVRLSLLAKVPEEAIRMFERTGHMPSSPTFRRAERLGTIRAVLEAAGVEFTGGLVPGARLREQEG